MHIDWLFGQRKTRNFRFEQSLSYHYQQLYCKYKEGIQQQSSMGFGCFGRHLIYNVVTASFAMLKINVHNPIQIGSLVGIGLCTFTYSVYNIVDIGGPSIIVV